MIGKWSPNQWLELLYFWIYFITIVSGLPVSDQTENEFQKFSIDLNKTPEENMVSTNPQMPKNDKKRERKRVRMDDGHDQKPIKRKKHSSEPVLNENGECLVHRPRCEHWKEMSFREKERNRSKFNRMIMTPEEKQQEHIRIQKYRKDPVRNAIVGKKWYEKNKLKMTEEKKNERKRQVLEASRRFTEKKKLGLPIKKYVSRIRKLKMNVNET